MKSSQSGFTIIELMIATAIFSIVLLITTTTIIGISQTYVKGSVQGQTQQTARAVLSDISQDIQFNNADSINLSDLSSSTTNDKYYFCIGSDVYVYNLDEYLSTSQSGPGYSTWALVRYAANSCPSSAPSNPNAIAGSVELLAANQRVGQLYISPVTINGTEAYLINLEIGYGDSDLLNVSSGSYISNGQPTNPPANYEYPYQCQSGSDSSFCAVSALTTTIAPRIND